jgi:hypothetical protein
MALSISAEEQREQQKLLREKRESEIERMSKILQD